MGGSVVTREEALEAISEERRGAMQAEIDQAAEAEEAEQMRQSALAEAQERAVAILDERNTLLPEFTKVLGQAAVLAYQLRDLKEEYSSLTTRCRKLGGVTNTMFPQAFAVDPKERQILRDALQVLSSIGGHV